MSDQSCKHSPLLTGVAGGVIGAALTQAVADDRTAELRREIEDRANQLAAIERERLSVERERLQLAESARRRAEAESIFRHALLWLEHCNNDERCDFLVRRHGEAIATALAPAFMAALRACPEIARLLADIRTAQDACAHLNETKGAWEKRLAALEREDRRIATRTWTISIAGMVAIPLLAIFAPRTTGTLLVLLVSLFAVIVAHVFRRTAEAPWPSLTLPDGSTAPRRLRPCREHLARVVEQLVHESSAFDLRLALAREALNQYLAENRSERALGWLIQHTPIARTHLDQQQTIYPPQLRCTLAAVEPTRLAALLGPSLANALTTPLPLETEWPTVSLSPAPRAPGPENLPHSGAP